MTTRPNRGDAAYKFSPYHCPVMQLSPPEILIGAMAGVMRQTENIKLDRQPNHGDGGLNQWHMHVEGTLSEMALAKFLGVFWNGKGSFRDLDVGGLVDVRSTAWDSGSLIAHDEDENERQLWLLTGIYGTYKVRGWIYAREAKNKELYWEEKQKGRPAYCVPQSHLNPPVATAALVLPNQ